ncbi:hypothetical protein JST97_07355 [bacterium]|nr:hypothetical protein [bacterium]
MRISSWTPQAFLARGLTLVALIALSFAYANYLIDSLGVFGHEKPEGIAIYHTNERFAKYALALRYIPDHFDTLLIGGSNSDNFPVQATGGPNKVYNASLNGGNLCELLPLVERATASGKIKKIYFCIDPYHTKNASYKTGTRLETTEHEIYGSVTLLKSYAYARGGLSGHPVQLNAANGVLADRVYAPPQEWWETYSPAEDEKIAREGFPFDPAAEQQLRRLAEICREHKIQLRVFLYIYPGPIYKVTRPAVLKYQRNVSRILGQEVLNPNESSQPVLRSVIEDRANFRDGCHLVEPAAQKVWPALYNWVEAQP